MATTKVSALAAKTSIAGSEELLINDGGTSKKVTATNLLAGVSVADGSISTAKIADDAVTEAKLANAINTAIAANTAKTSNATHTGDVTGATELTISSGAVETGMIADDAVTADKLANSINTEIAANTAKVTNATHTGDVTGATALTIANDAVTTAKILDDAVTAAKLANSINTDIATGVTANTTANAALPKSGGAMTGAITTNSTFDGRDVATDGTKLDGIEASADVTDATNVASAGALMKSGGTMTGSAHGSTDTDTSNTGSVTLNFTTNQNFVLTLTGNVTLANPSTETVGQSGFITFIQDGTGSRTVSLGTDYETAGGAGLTLTSTASATDIVPYVVVASGRILLGTPQLAFA
jgi:hypothetical protein